MELEFKHKVDKLLDLLEQLKGVEQPIKYHPEIDAYNHSIQVFNEAISRTYDRDLILAALFHDIGKARQSHGHEKISIELLKEFEFISDKTLWLVENHFRIVYLLNGEMKKQGKINALRNHLHYDDLLLLRELDLAGRKPNYNPDWSRQRLKKYLLKLLAQGGNPLRETLHTNKLAGFQQKLLEWFSTNGRKFPWRKSGLSNYQVVISEVLLQRTKAETVARFYPSFIKQFPSWKSIASAKEAEIEEALKPIGLQKQRAPRLLGLAQEMVKRNGRFPKTREELEAIPFIGQYIASAVLLLIYKEPQPLLDVNMTRVLERFFGPRKMADIRYDPYLQGLARQVVNCEKPKRMNWAILDFAGSICKASNPLCANCLFNKDCYFINN